MGVYLGHYDYDFEWDHYECNHYRGRIDQFNGYHYGGLHLYDYGDHYGFFGPHDYCLDYLRQ
jgi:hypothetical protein